MTACRYNMQYYILYFLLRMVWDCFLFCFFGHKVFPHRAYTKKRKRTRNPFVSEISPSRLLRTKVMLIIPLTDLYKMIAALSLSFSLALLLYVKSPIMVRSHQIICSRLSDRTAKNWGAAPIASNSMKPVRLDSLEQIYSKIFWCEWSIMHQCILRVAYSTLLQDVALLIDGVRI